MKAVLCAAGVGMRMRPLTDHIPKALLMVGKKRLVEYVLDGVAAAGLREAVIVVGHGADRLKKEIGPVYGGVSITYVVNPEYANTQNIYSLYMVRREITDGMVFLNADTIWHENILRSVVDSPHHDAFVLSEPHEIEQDSIKAHVSQEGRLIEIGKEIGKETHGAVFGIYKLSQEASERYFALCEELFRRDPLYKKASFVVPFSMLAAERPIAAVRSEGRPWAEIDVPEDYEVAHRRSRAIAGKRLYFNCQSHPNSKQHPSYRWMLVEWAEEAIGRVRPDELLRRRMSFLHDKIVVDGKGFPIKGRRLFVIGAGKASAAMAEALLEVVDPRIITDGIIVSHNISPKTRHIELHEADHPLPSERSVAGTQKIFDLKNRYRIGREDLVVALMSGGGSSLLTYPADGITLSDKRRMVEVLIASGANVHEMTVLKKKVSGVKGGKLAQFFYPTPIISLTVSDVVGNDLDVIASGPLTCDRTTPEDALRIVEKYRLECTLPPSIMNHLLRLRGKGVNGHDAGHVHHYIMGDNATALQGAAECARRQGFAVSMKTDIQGEARVYAEEICREALSRAPSNPTLYLYGGETTVILGERHGKGGRNQELVLAALNILRKYPPRHHFVLASLGTDGIDFIPESAGGIIDNAAVDHVITNRIDTEKYLRDNDAFTLLSAIGSNISCRTPTGTNVGDIIMCAVFPQPYKYNQ